MTDVAVRAVTLVRADGTTSAADLAAPAVTERPTSPLQSRVAYAAAHVIPKPWADNVPGAPADIDWDATLAFRRHVYGWGLGVADAMDTASATWGSTPPRPASSSAAAPTRPARWAARSLPA